MATRKTDARKRQDGLRKSCSSPSYNDAHDKEEAATAARAIAATISGSSNDKHPARRSSGMAILPGYSVCADNFAYASLANT